jgi:glycosyltransferase involved in cell wall biosynthesis
MPTEKAEGLEAMKLCEALSGFAEINMLCPRRNNTIKANPFEFYKVIKKFSLNRLPVIDIIFLLPNKFTFFIEAASFSIVVCLYLLIKTGKNDIIFSHDAMSIFFISFFRKNCFYDIHDFPKDRYSYRSLFGNLKGIMTTNNWKEKKLAEIFHLDAKKIMSHPNGVDLDNYDIKITKDEARLKLNLPCDKILIGYVGMLKTMKMAKGIDIAMEAARLLPENTKLIFVGGNEQDIDYYQDIANKSGVSAKIIFTGWAKQEQIPIYLKSFDILIAPYPSGKHYEYFMCPMKLIEYMASRRPIVVSNLNSVRELVTAEQEAVLVHPQDPVALAGGILKILNNPALGERISANAWNKVQELTWAKRAEKIYNFINSLI